MSLTDIQEGLPEDTTQPTNHQCHHIHGPKKHRRPSEASHVDIDFFDPSGVKELNRTLSRISTNGRAKHSDSGSDVTLNSEPFDYEKMLRQFVEKRDEQDIPSRQLGVSFENLGVVGLGSTASYHETLGSLLNPLNYLGVIQNARHPPLRQILSGFEGVVRPGEMLLVLGSPGSGCSTLLKMLANHRDEYYSVEGEVHYDSFSPEEIAKHYRGDVQYCPEDDVHFPTLTVKQTLDFAAKTRAPQTRIGGVSRSDYVNSMTEVLSTIFGLKHVQDTPVGDNAIRGVSGGEKKRVSIAEALATRSRVGSWDNSTRGLDASTALEFGRALRIATDIEHLATIVSIYQASETLYSLFDKVAVIYEGRMAYFGPAREAKQYFLDMGYEPANRQTTPDFLVTVTDPLGRIPREGFSNQPRSAAEFAEHFKNHALGRQNREDIRAYKDSFVGMPDKKQAYHISAMAEHSDHTRPASAYTISLPMQARAVILRRAQILKGNPMATIFNMIAFLIQGTIIGTVFLQVPDSTSAYFSRGGVLFFSILFCALSSMAEIPSLYAQRPIVLRHQRAAMYHPAIEALALTIVDIPITFLLTVVFGILIYFIVGLQRTPAQFFTFYLFLFSLTLTMKAWFRAIAAAFSSEATAQSFAGVILLGMVLYVGYSIPKPSMIGALSWITYINPVRYAFEAIMANEFHTVDGTCAGLVPQGTGYDNITLANQVCTTVGSVPGEATVNGDRYIGLSFGFYQSNIWRNYGIVAAFFVAFLFGLLYFTEVNTSNSLETARVLFLRGKKKLETTAAPKDTEKSEIEHEPAHDEKVAKDAEDALALAPVMTDMFSWQHLEYVVPVPDGHRMLLNDISGYVPPGKLTALMGESGAGKTTLLNVLAQRTSMGVVKGDRFVNGQALPSDFQAQTGYCQQMDTHVPTDSVREALLMSAKLRQPESVSLAEKEAYVDTCLKMCGLEDYADATVGSLGVEHRKRTTIAVELAAKPKLLLFLDEPTSGLDSQSAWAIMDFLRGLADKGQAILCTIHQPSAELFQVFDRLLLLKKGGQTVYFGDIGKNAETLIHYFERNKSRPCEPGENPAEFMLDVIGAGATASATQDFYQVWKHSPEAEKVQQEIEQIHAEGRSRPAVSAALHSEFATSWGNQFRLLLKRDLLFRYRDATYLLAKLVLNIVGGLFIGFTFWRAKDSQQGTQNKLFAIFMTLIVGVPTANQLQVPFLNMRKIYEIRERPSRMYSWTALLCAQFLAELPWNIFASSLLFLCWFWTVGFPSSRGGYTYLMLSIMCPIYYTSFAQGVAAMTPNAEIAALAFSLLFSFVLNFNGVMQPFRQLGWWRWMYRLSPYTYLVEGLLGQAIGKSSIVCATVELVTFDPPSGLTCGSYMTTYIAANGGYVTEPDATTGCQFCSTDTTDQFLGNNFNIFYSHHWRNFGILWAFIIFNICAIFIFTYFMRIRTQSIFVSLKHRLTSKKKV